MLKHLWAYRSLYRFISRMEIVDCHEHLHPEDTRLAMPVDVSTLLGEYCGQDLLNAGMSMEEYGVVFGSEASAAQKWAVLQPYLPSIEMTSYYRAFCISLKKHCGIKKLDAASFEKASLALQSGNTPGACERALAASRIRYAMVSSFPATVRVQQLSGRCRYVPMYYVPPMAKEHGFLRHPETLADLERQADEFIALALQGGRAVKLRVDTPYIAAAPAQAQQAMEDWLGGVREFCPELCWYFVELLLQRCAVHDLPVSVHTGYWGDFRALSPEHLIPLIESHPQNRFDLFHLGYPYVNSSLLLAKTHPNVCIDLCWVYLISEQLARDAICQIVDFVPLNKVMGFGADYWHYESVYGHRRLMDRTMALALADKVADGTLTLAQAKRWAKAMLWDNPVRFYGLE